MKITKLTENLINSFADSSSIAQRGKSYFQTRRVISVKLFNKIINSEVLGSKKYKLKIILNPNNDIVTFSCDCPYDGYCCKHKIAVLYELMLNKEKYFSNHKPSSRINKDNNFIKLINLEDIKNRYQPKMILNSFALCNQVKIVKQNAFGLIAKVSSEKDYDVTLNIRNYGPSNMIIESGCSCYNYGFFYCNHALATIFAILLKNGEEKKVISFKEKIEEGYYLQQLNSLCSTVDSFQLDSHEEKKFFLIFNIEQSSNKNFSISIQRSYILKNGQQARASSITKSFLNKNKDILPLSQQKIIDTIKLFYEYGNYYDNFIKTDFKSSLDLQLLQQLRNLYAIEPQYFFGGSFYVEKAIPCIKIEENKEKLNYFFKISAKFDDKEIFIKSEQIHIVNEKELWASKFDSQNNNLSIFEIETKFPSQLIYFLKYSDLQMNSEQLIKFIESSYQKLSLIAQVILPEEFAPKEIILEPKPRLFLQDYGNSFSINLHFLYDTRDVPYESLQDIVFRDSNGKLLKIKRNISKEQEYISYLNESSVVEKDNLFLPTINPSIWLVDILPKLSATGFEIYGKQNLKNQKIHKEEAQLFLHVSSGIDWFDLKGELSFGEEKVPLNSLFDALNKHERFVKLNDGSFGVLPQKWFESLSGVTGFLDSDSSENTTRASVTQISIVESLLGIANNYNTDKKFEEIKDKFKTFKKIKNVSLPKGLNAPLREYQKEGYNWLHFLKEFSFGGCLADEMGLGKTLQVLTLLLYEKEQGNTIPTLVIVPKSLGFNWLAEIQKFTPNLNAYFHHGNDRPKTKKEILNKKTDLIITTYGTIRNDSDIFKQIKFHYIILDESQQIKNFLSKSAKSVFGLKSSYRLALTGTPIENSSLELWSQFAFLNPGLLGNIEYFKNTFNKSIEIEKNKNKALSLRNIINPFILLRKKEFVAKELPEKQITVSYCDMDPQQREVYDIWKEKFREEITNSIANEGMNKSKMKILKGLIILRQICNHPSLIDASYKGKSGKFENMINKINEILAGGHKILIFSSFVKMLKLFKDYFDKENINYSYLDGSTTKRKEIVEEFQTNENIKLFLISLKAGGLGLNLTSADYVFIVDPWWNPASEMQAIDRAHRIGQKKNVFVYKIIMKETVEEKILELQQSKIELVKDIISIDSHIFKNLTKNDIQKIFS